MSIMHYSIHIEEALENESQIISKNAFQTKYQNSNTGITNLRITLKPRNNKSIFNNIQTTNIVKNSKGETITFNTPSITGKAYKDEDGCWRTRVFNIKTLEKAKEILNKLITRAESTLIATSSTNGDTTINAENQGG